MKPWWLLVIIPACAVAAYFVVYPGSPATSPATVAAISADNPFFHSRPVEIPFGSDKMDYANDAFKTGRYDDAAAALAGACAERTSPSDKAACMEMAGQVLFQKNDSASRKHSREIFETVISQFGGKAQVDASHYYLGVIAVQDSDAPRALYHLTTVVKENPQSPLAMNSAHLAQQVAGLLVGQDESIKGRIVNYLKPLLPHNTTALVGILTSFFTTIIWFANDWRNHWTKLIRHKDPVLWFVILMMVTLAGLNYILEDQSHAKSMIEATKGLPGIVRR